MSDPKPEDQPEEIVEERDLEAEIQDYKNKYLRQLAETENTRKRLQKEKQELTDYAISNVIADFLGPIDHMESALSHTDNMSEEVKHWGVGFKMILTQFKDVLKENGVKQMNAMGEMFDPHLHEAIEVIETDEFAPGTIVEECLRGFKMGEKVIRPARVKVAKELPKENKE
ncbi:MAG: nucleotide exchange factor GrpE [Chlamydiia bacterium]|nr:nucleotide exchange factor GrpE [Chlamydiia bacterium]